MADQFGFPAWTLWGMGLAACGALIAIVLAFLAQSPRLLSRLKLTGQRLDLRARAFTGYGLALLLLSMGFFLAGVPLDASRGQAATEAIDLPAAMEAATEAAEDAIAAGNGRNGSQSGAMVGLPTAMSDSASGAMSDLITPQATLEPGAIITGTVEATAEAGVLPAATGEPPAATATRAPTATPIFVPTAHINNDTSTLPVRRLPGGPVLVVLTRGDTVIPLTGNAFRSGEVWQEIQTVDGVIGWVQERFLTYDE